MIVEMNSEAAAVPSCISPIVRERDILNAIAEHLGQEPTEEMIFAHVSKVLIEKDGIRVIGIEAKAA